MSDNALSQRRWIAGGVVFTLLLAFWYAFLVTHGLLRFDRHELGWRIFPGMWDSLIHGRFDLNPEDVKGEAFHRDGKSFSYYGIFPALLRGLAQPFVGLYHAGVEQVSCWLAALVSVLSLLGAGVVLHRRNGWALLILYALTLALGSPIVIGLAAATVYHEAALWGCAWSCVFDSALLVLACAPAASRLRPASLIVMGLSAGLALLSRTPPGFLSIGLFAATAVFFLRERFLRRALLVSSALLLVACLLQGLINQERWGSPFIFRPMELHEAFEGTQRGEIAREAGETRLDRIPTSTRYYFLPELHHFRGQWPFLRLSIRGSRTGRPPYDLAEYGMPIGIFSPAILVLAVLGFARTCLPRPKGTFGLAGLLFSGAAAGATFMLLTFDTLAPRFFLDLTPSLAALGLLATLTDAKPAAPLQRRIGLGILSVLVAFSLFASHITLVLLKVHGTGAPSALKPALERFLSH